MGLYFDNYRDSVQASGISMDPFQIDACRALEDGHDVLVCAPTGSGKTLIAHFGIELAFATETRCVYTTPIKALSNQKYRELCSRYGSEHIGLLTGDVSINRDAPILVVTTEVLRNLLYSHSDMSDLGYVVLDEVHYLADPERGPTWEEIILELSRNVRVISLSATIANSSEFHEWLESVRGNTRLVVSHNRPVPLVQHVLSGRTFADLYEGGPSHTLGRDKNIDQRALRVFNSRLPDKITPHIRQHALDEMQHRGLLPAIHFIYSRKMCELAVKDLVRSRVSLTNPAERKLIHQSLDPLRAELSEEDKAALSFRSFENALACGYAAHHAGVYPPFKEIIERLMQRGLIKLVYATSTLALGINMPVKTTVIESLRKFNGTEFQTISGIEYTQLIGRAGRRGKDTIGHAIILPTNDTDPETLYRLGAGELEPLNSAFFPSYNTVVNQLSLREYPEARATLARSFAQFQRNQDVARIEISRERTRVALEAEEKRLGELCDCGSIAEYVKIRHTAPRASSSQRKKAKKAYRHRVQASFHDVNIGDVIVYAYGTDVEYGYVAQVKADRVRVATWMGDLVWITPDKVRSELRIVDQYQLPQGMKLREPGTRDVLADHIAELVSERVETGLDFDLTESWDRGVVRETDAVLHHPVHSCPHRDQHIEDATSYRSLVQQLAHLDNQRVAFDDSVGGEFDATCELLAHLGILTGERGNYRVSRAATPLRRIHSTADLLIFECLKDQVFAELDPPTLAGMLSCFTFKERRSKAMPPVDFKAWRVIQSNLNYLSALEYEHGLQRQPEITSNGSIAVTQWANGTSLDRVLKNCHMLPGDFITGIRRTLDLLQQVEMAMEGTPLEETARQARTMLARPGVIDII